MNTGAALPHNLHACCAVLGFCRESAYDLPVSFVGVNVLRPLGERTLTLAMEVCQSLAVLGTVLALAVRPAQWPRTVREVFARQLFVTGLGAVRYTAALAILAGILVVVQTDVWLGRMGMSQMSGRLLVAVLVRELGPFLGNLIVIVSGGSAVATELGLMKLRGEVRVLEAQGIEPLPYLVMPRVLATGLSTLGLSVWFILVAFASGFVFGSLLGEIRVDALTFGESFAAALQPKDMLNVVLKGLLPGLYTGAICTTCGLNVGGVVSGVPAACRRALVRSVAALFVISALASVLSYL